MSSKEGSPILGEAFKPLDEQKEGPGPVEQSTGLAPSKRVSRRRFIASGLALGLLGIAQIREAAQINISSASELGPTPKILPSPEETTRQMGEFDRTIAAINQEPNVFLPIMHPTPEGLLQFLPSQGEGRIIHGSVVWTREPKYEGEMALWALFGAPDIQAGGQSWDIIGYAPVGSNPPRGIVQAVAFSIGGEMIGESVGVPKEIDMAKQTEGMIVDLEAYPIQKGDRLNSLLLKRGALEDTLSEWVSRVCRINHLSSPDEIKEGIVLWIPTNVPFYYNSEYGAGSPDHSMAKALGFQGYTVLPGETPDWVAGLYSLSPETLLAVNGIKDIDEYWQTGRNLIIPDFDLETLNYSPLVLSRAESYVHSSKTSEDPLIIIARDYSPLEVQIQQRAELVVRYIEAGAPAISPYSIIWRDQKIFHYHGEGLKPTQENVEKVLARYMLDYELNPAIAESLIKLGPGIRAINRLLESSPYWDGPPIPENLAGRNVFFVGGDYSWGTEGFPEITGNWEEILRDPSRNKAVIEGYLFYIIPHELGHAWVEPETESSSLPHSWYEFKHTTLSIGVGVARRAMGLGFENIGFMELDPRVVLVYSRLKEGGTDAFPLLRDVMVAGNGHPELIRKVVNLYEQNRRAGDPSFDEVFANFFDSGIAHTIVTEEEKAIFLTEFEPFIGVGFKKIDKERP